MTTGKLTTNDALKILHDDIKSFMHQFEQRNVPQLLHDMLHHNSRYSTLNWWMVFWIIVSIINLTIGAVFRTWTIIYPIFAIVALTILGLFVNWKENELRLTKMKRKVDGLLATLQLAMSTVKWDDDNYPYLYTPFTPSISLQWAYRDGKLVNIPYSLLVRGDILVIKPGQVSPGFCEAVDDPLILRPNEIYTPRQRKPGPIPLPTLRSPLEPKKFRLIDTPYIANLQKMFDRFLKRPVTNFNQRRFLLVTRTLEQKLVPVMFMLVLMVNFVRVMFYERLDTGFLVELFVVESIGVILPLLPLVSPVVWVGLNAYGMSRFKTLFNTTSKVSLSQSINDDAFTESDGVLNESFVFRWSEVWYNFLNIIKGLDVIRSSNILHVLGSLSALCVVDKKGLLSWPNPTPEKIFFLRSCESSATSTATSSESLAENNIFSMSSPDLNSSNSFKAKRVDSAGKDDVGFCLKIKHRKPTIAEVLDMTHDHSVPFKVEFDNPDWDKFRDSLKPIGLSILLNTCNSETHENYSNFCSHITCEAMYNEDLVPVMNRRCLCEISKQIGFLSSAKSIFKLQHQVSVFRHLPSEIIRRDKFTRALQTQTKLKFAFPHMVSVVVRDQSTDTFHLMSQGTADVILDSCIEYWNGKGLVTLTSNDRKRILDFYSRTSLTSYCSAFSYTPLSQFVDTSLADNYVEIPPDWKVCSKRRGNDGDGLRGTFSADSLLYLDPRDDNVIHTANDYVQVQSKQIFQGMITMQYQVQTDMIQLIERLEKACIRFVHFSKENELRSRVFSNKMGLESGWNCHISLLSDKSHSNHHEHLNDIRLSERIGKRRSESVSKFPNCDTDKLFISPLQARNKSFSAPSDINVDLPMVKFDEDTFIDDDDDAPSGGNSDDASNNSESSDDKEDDSVVVHSIDLSSRQEGWQSLSCLTDSTEHSAPVNFDMSNRAKLPRGIENIRPHLEEIDNVPLLVSLFTDCTTTVTTEMIKIMQDYGQIICVVGSASNFDNVDIFLQADASIAIEPLYPQVCQQKPVYTCVSPVFGPSPLALSRTLNALPCSLTFKREDPVSLYHLIFESRHFMLLLWNCVQFFVTCVVTIAFIQLISIMFFLPQVFTIELVLWIACFVVPALSVSLVGLSADPLVMQRSAGTYKYELNWETTLFVVWNYCSKCIPIILFAILIFVEMLHNFCQNLHQHVPSANQTLTTPVKCVYFHPTDNDHVIGWRGEFSAMLSHARYTAAFVVLIYFVTLSSAFVHREYSFWKRKPFENRLWLYTSLLLVTCQLIITIVHATTLDDHVFDVSIWGLLGIALSPFVLFCIIETIKWREIKINERYLTRARLMFDTKLGMHSPF